MTPTRVIVPGHAPTEPTPTMFRKDCHKGHIYAGLRPVDPVGLAAWVAGHEKCEQGEER